jgi:hypothetical protein
MLEALPQWSWDVLEDQWNEGFEYLKKYVEEYGHARVPKELKYKNYSLGQWAGVQRKARENLDLKRIQLLEELPQWSWNYFEVQWNEGFEYLKKYVAEQYHARVPQNLKYENFNLGAWVSHQRNEKNRLSSERIQLLELLPQWSWNPFEDQWNEGFEYLKKYIEEEGHARIPTRFKYEDFNLGTWVSHQRDGRDKLDLKKTQLLEELSQWSWDVLEDQWNEGIEYLKKYVEEHGHARVPSGLKYQNFNLGTWVSNQRVGRDKLDLKKIQLLEDLPRWSWNQFEDQWNEGFEYLKKFAEEQGHTRVPQNLKYANFNLGTWVSTQRVGRDKLDLKKIQLLANLPRWSWNSLEDKWNEGFEYLKKYVEEHGHARAPLRFKYEDFNLGEWISSQRRKKDKLDLERIQLLEELPQWSWNPLVDQWNEGFEYLKKYVEEHGHARVFAQFKYEGFNLGQWVGIQRRSKKSNKLDLERIKLLEALPQWSWAIKSK